MIADNCCLIADNCCSANSSACGQTTIHHVFRTTIISNYYFIVPYSYFIIRTALKVTYIAALTISIYLVVINEKTLMSELG